LQLKSELLGSQLPVIAKWEHILRVYELDKARLFHQLYKLTDTHLNPTAQTAMKVGKDHCALCCGLSCGVQEVANGNNES
jgi:hypothetical protein